MHLLDVDDLFGGCIMKVSLLKQKDFFLLIFGKLVSNIGSQMQSFALSLYVLSITGSATKFASVLAITIIPRLILGPIAGVFADWFDRKKMMVGLDILSGVIVGIFAIIFKINGGFNLIHIYILNISLSLISVVFDPVTSTIIPSVLKKDELVDGNSLNSLFNSIGSLFAPALAGVLLGAFGLEILLIINSISFILSGISESFINVPKIKKVAEAISFKRFNSDFKEGIGFIKNQKFILTIIMIAVVVNFAFNPLFTIGVTYMAKQIIHVSDFQYGLIESFEVVSMLVAPFIASRIYKKYHHGKVEFYVILITGLLIGVLSIIPSNRYLNIFSSNLIPYISSIAIIFVIGIVVTTGNIVLNTLMQENVPLDIMGRVLSVMGVACGCAIPFGQMIFGVLYDKISTSLCFLITSLIMIICILCFRKALCGNQASGVKEEPQCALTEEIK